jgi:hypothetical protein
MSLSFPAAVSDAGQSATGVRMASASVSMAWPSPHAHTRARARCAQVQVCEGATRAIDGTVRKRFAAEAELVPLELVLRCHPSGAPRRDVAAGAAVAIKAGDTAIFLGVVYYGWLAHVLPAKGFGVDEAGNALTQAGAPH